jgi:methylmalonyl-CoA mutase N-terminal domain/subunit
VETNKRFRYLLAQGQGGLSVAFDLPTQMGYDADHPMAQSEAGKVGVAISSVVDMQELLEAIPLDRVSTSMTINATASILLCLYIAVAERQGVASEKLSGTVQNDILKEYIARGTYVFPPTPSMRLITDTFAFCRERVPALEHDLDLRLSRPRGGVHGGPGGRVHPGQRHRVRRRRSGCGAGCR